jgi:SAM-dependent methyltransferase
MNYKKINEAFYKKNYWEIDRSRNKWFSKYVKSKIILRWIEKKIKNRGVLLDGGGGTGNWAWFFSPYFKKVIVSDISKKALAKIKENYIDKINCSILSHKLKDNSVDCILFIDVFEHIEEKDLLKMMKNARKILKDDGKIIIFSGLHGWGWGLFLQHIFNPKKRIKGNENLEGHVNRLDFKEYDSLFRKSGLVIEDYYFYSIILQQFTDFIKDRLATGLDRIFQGKMVGKNQKRYGQETKNSIRKNEGRIFNRIALKILSWISYMDIIFFGKFYKGNSIFFFLKKEKEQ